MLQIFTSFQHCRIYTYSTFQLSCQCLACGIDTVGTMYHKLANSKTVLFVNNTCKCSALHIRHSHACVFVTV